MEFVALDQTVRVIDTDPSHIQRLVVDRRRGLAGGQDEKPDIQVEVSRLLSSLGNAMNVEVDSRFDQT